MIKDTDLTNRELISDITKTRSIRLALNCVGGRSTTNMLKLLGNDAYIITYGAMAREPLMLPASPLIFKGLTATGFWVSKWHQENPEERKKELAWLCEHFQNGELKGVDHEKIAWAGEGVSDTQGWERVKEALAKIREGRSGKKMVLVNYDDSDLK